MNYETNMESLGTLLGFGGMSACTSLEAVPEIDGCAGSDGTLTPVAFRFSTRLCSDGRLLYFLGVQYDITNQVEAEQELNRLNQLLGQT